MPATGHHQDPFPRDYADFRFLFERSIVRTSRSTPPHNHSQGTARDPTPAETASKLSICEMATFVPAAAKPFGHIRPGRLDAHGANGGTRLALHILTVLSQYQLPAGNPLAPTTSKLYKGGPLGTPGVTGNCHAPPHLQPRLNAGGRTSPGTSPRRRCAWGGGPSHFHSKPHQYHGTSLQHNTTNSFSGWPGLPAGIHSLQGTCVPPPTIQPRCNHSFPTPLNIGNWGPQPSNASAKVGGVMVSYLPAIIGVQNDLATVGPRRVSARPLRTWPKH